MCDICHRTPCLSRCPNAPEPMPVATCDYCGGDILEGDEYFSYNRELYHNDCFEEAAVDILIEDGATKRIACSEDFID